MKSNGRNIVHDLLIFTRIYWLISIQETHTTDRTCPVSAIGKEVLDAFDQDGTIRRGLSTSDTAEP